MNDKAEVIARIKVLLRDGSLQPDELLALIEGNEANAAQAASRSQESPKPANKVSATDAMFVTGGVVMFIAIQVLIGQLGEGWSSLGLFGAISCALIAVILWLVAFIQTKRGVSGEVGRGITQSFLVTGSLLWAAAAVYMAIEIASGIPRLSPDESGLLAAAGLGLVVVSILHVLYGLSLKRPVVFYFAALTFCTGVLLWMLNLLIQTEANGIDIYVLTFIAVGSLLSATMRVLAMLPSPKLNGRGLDGLGRAIILVSMWVASFGDLHIVWYLLLIGTVLGLFYLSISNRSTSSLTLAAFFLTLTLISMSFRYFGGMSVAISLMLSAIAVIGTATVAVMLRKRYLAGSELS